MFIDYIWIFCEDVYFLNRSVREKLIEIWVEFGYILIDNVNLV